MNDDDFPPRLRSQSNARVKRLIEDVGRDGPSTAQIGATADGVAHALRVAKWVKIAAAIGSAGILAIGGTAAMLAPPARPEAPNVRAPFAAPTAIVAPSGEPTATLEPPPAETMAAPIVAPHATARAPVAARSTEEQDSSMSAELQRVLAIRASMLSKDHAGALRGADAYERDYPNGSFMPEAEAMSIEALHDLGRTEEAKSRASRFLARYGNSPQAARIRALQDH
jgi:hypothetical protein